MNLRGFFIAVSIGLIASAQPLWAKCDNWYLSTLECIELRKELAADTSNNICGEILEKIPKASKDLDHWLKFSHCLKEVSPPQKIPAYLKKASGKFPQEESWIFQTLKNYRIHQESKSALGFAYLAENLVLETSLIRGELSETYLQNSEFVLAARSYLSETKDSGIRQFTINFKFKSLFKAASISYSAPELMDSLLVSLNEMDENQLIFLSDISWEQNYPKGALVCLLRLKELGFLNWDYANMWIQKFNNSKNFRESKILLSAFDKANNPREKQIVFGYKIFLAYELQDWAAFPRLKSNPELIKNLPPDYQYYLSYGLLKASYKNQNDSLRKASAKVANMLVDNRDKHWSQKALFVKVQIHIAEGKLKEARKKLLAEKHNPNREAGSGEILHWMAVVDLFEGYLKSADSLLVLSSSYTGEDFTQKSLEYRHFLVLDSSKSNVQNMLAGLEEHPSSLSEKLKYLAKIPENSALWGHAQLRRSEIFENLGKTDSSLAMLKRLSESQNSSWLGHLAKSKLNFLKEADISHEKSLEAYDEILLKYQRGILSEFSRERVKKIKSSSK